MSWPTYRRIDLSESEWRELQALGRSVNMSGARFGGIVLRNYLQSRPVLYVIPEKGNEKPPGERSA